MFDILLKTQTGQQAINQIIRPFRNSIYTLPDIPGMNRYDFNLISPQDLNIQCSIYQPFAHVNQTVVIYIHGNCGNRIEGIPCAQYLLELHISLIVCDLSGCGQSDGDHVTLGMREQDDIKTVIQYAKQLGYKEIVLWGRSMGAVTAILSSRQEEIKCMIIDSPFSNFRKLTIELGSKRFNMPEFLVDLAQDSFQKHVIEMTQYDPFKIDLVPIVKILNIPALFIYSDQDKLIDSKHTKEILKYYKGYHEVHKFNGDHNTVRNTEYYKRCIDFIERMLNMKKMQTQPSLHSYVDCKSQRATQSYYNLAQTSYDLSNQKVAPTNKQQFCLKKEFYNQSNNASSPYLTTNMQITNQSHQNLQKPLMNQSLLLSKQLPSQNSTTFNHVTQQLRTPNLSQTQIHQRKTHQTQSNNKNYRVF